MARLASSSAARPRAKMSIVRQRPRRYMAEQLFGPIQAVEHGLGHAVVQRAPRSPACGRRCLRRNRRCRARCAAPPAGRTGARCRWPWTTRAKWCPCAAPPDTKTRPRLARRRAAPARHRRAVARARARSRASSACAVSTKCQNSAPAMRAPGAISPRRACSFSRRKADSAGPPRSLRISAMKACAVKARL